MNQRNATTIGLDVGDKHSQVCVLDPLSGEVLEEARIRTSPAGMARYFAAEPTALVALEVGTHSPWIGRAVKGAGHDVIVANARNVRLIHSSSRKNDRLDAEKLARLARLDVKLLSPIEHRSSKAQVDLARVRSRGALVRTRTKLVVHMRGSVKAFGARLPGSSTGAFATRAREHLPAELGPALEPILTIIEILNEVIRQIDRELAELATTSYPETRALQQVTGVGVLTSLAFVLTLGDPTRFKKSREVGPYLGLTPAERQSGNSNPRRRITKAGDELLRRLLVQCAHQIIRREVDTDLKRAVQRIMAGGGERAKAVTAVARKLAVLLHHLWVTGEVYEPLHHQPDSSAADPPA